MKTQELGKASLVFITAVFFAMGSVSLAAQTSTHETGTKDVKEKVTDAAQAIKKYSVDQRDEAVKKARAALDDLAEIVYLSCLEAGVTVKDGVDRAYPIFRVEGLETIMEWPKGDLENSSSG